MLDRLTGLPSRRIFERKLWRVLHSGCGRTTGIFHVDLDRFEAVNQTLGRTAGNELLVQAADRLRTFERRGHFVARLGSDRFAVLTDAEDPMVLANEAIASLAEPFQIRSHQVALTASAGVASCGTPATPGTMMISAGIALQWAKSDGRATCRRFEPERNERELIRRQLWLAMPSAIACEQIALSYQPLIELRSGEVIGAEALARWTHPKLGAIPPETFISVAEERGLIVALGAMLLRRACAAAASWRSRDDRPAAYVSVNVAAAQLRDPTFLETVTNTLAHTGLAPTRLQLEITEHTLVETGPETLKNLESLAQLGIRIAVDDFGTGYSNFLCLSKLPIHELKVAHSFTRSDFPDLLKPIMVLGQTLNLTMTAEGIETEDQADMVSALGYDTGQGWHFGHPMTAERIHHYFCDRPTLT